MSTCRVLTLNAGSSSLKAAVYAIDTTEVLLAAARVERIGMPEGRLCVTDAVGNVVAEQHLQTVDHVAALRAVLESLQNDGTLRAVDAVAHRVVHGGRYTTPEIITSDVIEELRRFAAVDPDHCPQTLAAIDSITHSYPGTPQIACFDTTFHHSMPSIAQRYPLPARFHEAGVKRYGFHGLSCEFVMSAIGHIDPTGASGRIVIAHLGSGASLTAVNRGESVDTTMGFSPAGGLMMGTRTGDLDPGVLMYLLRQPDAVAPDLDRIVNRDAGLLGVSGTSSDMRDLLAREATDPQAATAIALFCYLAKKSLGGLVVSLEGLDTLVFTGGIGEHSAPIRERIARGLEWMGLSIDPERNASASDTISTDASTIVVRVIKTNEDLMLARHAVHLLRSS